MTKRNFIGLVGVLTGAAAVAVGSLGQWVHGGEATDADVANSTERHWIVGAAIALSVVAVLVATWRSRARRPIRWVQGAAWFHVALVVGLSTLDASKKIGSSKPDTGDKLGWGLSMACVGIAVSLVGVITSSRGDRVALA